MHEQNFLRPEITDDLLLFSGDARLGHLKFNDHLSCVYHYYR